MNNSSSLVARHWCRWSGVRDLQLSVNTRWVIQIPNRNLPQNYVGVNMLILRNLMRVNDEIREIYVNHFRMPTFPDLQAFIIRKMGSMKYALETKARE